MWMFNDVSTLLSFSVVEAQPMVFVDTKACANEVNNVHFQVSIDTKACANQVTVMPQLYTDIQPSSMLDILTI